jgi:hypothetical protein
MTTCLRCDAEFMSEDKRQNRLCQTCRKAIEQDPSDEPEYDLSKRWGPRRNPDDG